MTLLINGIKKGIQPAEDWVNSGLNRVRFWIVQKILDFQNVPVQKCQKKAKNAFSFRPTTRMELSLQAQSAGT